MVRANEKAPPLWEVQVTRAKGDGLVIETLGPFNFSRACAVARRERGTSNPEETCVEMNRAEDQRETFQW